MTRNEWMVQHDVKPANTHQWHRITGRTWPSTGGDAAVAMLNTGVELANAQNEVWRSELQRFAPPGSFLDMTEAETFQRRGEIVGVAIEATEDVDALASALSGFAGTYGLTFARLDGVVWEADQMKVTVLTLLDGAR